MAASTTLIAQDSVVYRLACRRATDRLEHRSLTAAVGDIGGDAAAVWHRYFNGAGQMPRVQKGTYADWDPTLALSPLRRIIWRFISCAAIRSRGGIWPISSFALGCGENCETIS